ncbi:MAG TPA: 2-oxoacid:acceptor oxidoreductase subunit alpha, partial [Bacillales bacterium]|nr:2-oxoacid:acceptor oxidoreductase subunit alpha [Bacillales bacterium]
DDGISKRIIPGTKNGIYHVTGVEHDATGKPSESPVNRKEQMEKRLRKLKNLSFDTPVHKRAPHEKADLLIVGINSTRGAIEEAIPRLEEDGLKVNHAHLRLIHPFPVEELKPLVDSAERIAVVEQNATGQLASLIRGNVGHADKIEPLLKYDGNPFLPSEIYQGVKNILQLHVTQ